MFMMFWSRKTRRKYLEYWPIRKIWITQAEVSDSQAFVRSSIRQWGLTCVLLRPPVSLENTAVSTDNSTLSNTEKKPSRVRWWGKLVVAGGDQYLKLTCKELIPAPPCYNTRVDISLSEYQKHWADNLEDFDFKLNDWSIWWEGQSHQ